NPANLVLYGNHMPPLWPWLKQFALPSMLSIGATFLVLRVYFRNDVTGQIASNIPLSELKAGGRYAALGIGLAAAVLLLASALDLQLGLPTLACGAAAVLAVQWEKREAPWQVLRGVSWSVLLLVAGLFVLVAGLNTTGAVAELTRLLTWGMSQ